MRGTQNRSALSQQSLTITGRHRDKIDILRLKQLFDGHVSGIVATGELEQVCVKCADRFPPACFLFDDSSEEVHRLWNQFVVKLVEVNDIHFTTRIPKRSMILSRGSLRDGRYCRGVERDILLAPRGTQMLVVAVLFFEPASKAFSIRLTVVTELAAGPPFSAKGKKVVPLFSIEPIELVPDDVLGIV